MQPSGLRRLKIVIKEMQVRQGFLRKRWSKAKSELISMCLSKYERCIQRVKKYVRTDSDVDCERRKSSARLQPPIDRPIRRVTSKLKRKPSVELEKLRRKGDDWTANDLFRFEYSDPEEGTVEQRREMCFEWLDRLHDINKKYCYLAWYEAAIYACYYRLAPIITDQDEKKSLWNDVRREYAEVFLMGRRIWRRPTHPSRLRVFYDMAMLCVRFADVQGDSTIPTFRDLLEDATNFDFKVQNEVEFAKSIDKVTRLENYVIDQFYPRRRSSGSVRSSFRSRRNTDRSPSRRSETEDVFPDDVIGPPPLQNPLLSPSDPLVPLEESFESVSLSHNDVIPSVSNSDVIPSGRPRSLLIPTIVVHAPSRCNSLKGRSSVRFDKPDEEL